ncbi:MAG: NAD(P)H-hydrate dehydratase [Phycisphaerales bacterium]
MDPTRIESLPNLPPRPADGHKGTFGTVGVIGGCAGMHHDEQFRATMLGAPALAARGAIRTGCGLVKIATPMPIIEAVLTLAPFATGFGLEVDSRRTIIGSSAAPIIDELLRTTQAIVVGPGMGHGAEVGQMVHRLIGQQQTPIVIDADGLNVLAAMTDFVRDVRANMVLTPHPGEAARLMEALNIQGEPAGTTDQRLEVCAKLAQRIGCVVVLKGKGTIVADGQRVWICQHGTPAMGVGGTGDVLSGVIGSLIAQSSKIGSMDLFISATIGVQAHAMAGERWTEQHHATGGLIASELADELVEVIAKMRAG